MKKKLTFIFLVALTGTSSTMQAGLKYKTHLHATAAQGLAPALTLFIKTNPNDINIKDSDGFTPLHFAAARGHLACVTVLLNAHANVNTQSDTGETPLHFAARYNRLECVTLLLSHSNINELAINENGLTPLHHAAAQGHINCVKALVAKNIDTINVGEWTPLHAAVRYGHVACIEFLVENGALIGNAADLATEKKFHDIAQYLKEQAQLRAQRAQ
ncbi:ankyrin repeat domain-containing protein [bacterium]|nr:MAG: ankyrin repeat domain-containing protein [bacterium]